MISDFGDCDNFYYRICEDIYLLNDSEVSNKEVIEQTEKYIHKIASVALKSSRCLKLLVN